MLVNVVKNVFQGFKHNKLPKKDLVCGELTRVQGMGLKSFQKKP